MVFEKYWRGEISYEQMATDPQKNIITQAVTPGIENRARLHIYHTIDINPGDYFYLCSDGLKADEIWLVEAEDEAAAQAMLQRARERIELRTRSFDRYLPEESALARRGLAVTSGRWVGLFISENAEKMRDIFLEATGG